MRPTNRRIVALTALLILAGVLAGGSGRAAIYAPAFAGPRRLPTWAGGEPSVAFDPAGKIIYVVAPQGIPSLLNAGGEVVRTLDKEGVFDRENPDVIDAAPNNGVTPGRYGIGFWASLDGGVTWSRSANLGSLTGGGDTDVVVTPDRTVYVTDLEATSTAICSSRNFGATFASSAAPVDTCQIMPANQTGPINDRPWLSAGRSNELYVTYHDLVTGLPVVLKSTDRAQTFAPCGTTLDPQGPLANSYSPVAGALVGKPAVYRDGSIFTTVTVADKADVMQNGAFNHLFVTYARSGCSSTTKWKNASIFYNRGAELKLFQSIAIDGGGVLYALAAGRTAANQSSDNVWLFTSRDGGAHWSAPIRVNPPSLIANAMPALTGGLRGNQVAIGWYGTATNANPSNVRNQWRFYVATSFDAGKTFKYATLTPGPVHYGPICSDGVGCISGRNLADFTSIERNPVTGCLVAVYGGDPWNRPDIDEARDDGLSAPYVSRQTGGTCLR